MTTPTILFTKKDLFTLINCFSVSSVLAQVPRIGMLETIQSQLTGGKPAEGVYLVSERQAKELSLVNHFSRKVKALNMKEDFFFLFSLDKKVHLTMALSCFFTE